MFVLIRERPFYGTAFYQDTGGEIAGAFKQTITGDIVLTVEWYRTAEDSEPFCVDEYRLFQNWRGFGEWLRLRKEALGESIPDAELPEPIRAMLAGSEPVAPMSADLFADALAAELDQNPVFDDRLTLARHDYDHLSQHLVEREEAAVKAKADAANQPPEPVQ